MTDFGAMMKQAQGLQAKLGEAQARFAETAVEGAAGGGLVVVTLKGSGAMSDLRIDDSLFKDGDAETLADLIRAAHADAKARLDAMQEKMMSDALGPLAGLAGGMPGLPGLGGR